MDETTGLVRFGARDYDPQVGRWTSQDQLVISMDESANAYEYAKNLPGMLIDPLGLYWEYSQTSGLTWWVDPVTGVATLAGQGYSGTGKGLNNPDLEDKENVGPIPSGWYHIGPIHDAPYSTKQGTMNLTPRSDNEMFGRILFRIHGSKGFRNRAGSTGCIIEQPWVRDRIGRSQSHRLHVRR